MRRQSCIFTLLILISFLNVSSVLLTASFQHFPCFLPTDSQSHNCDEDLQTPLKNINEGYQKSTPFMVHEIQFFPFDNFSSIPQASYLNPIDLYALLIGVENYPGTVNDLSYCIDDIDSIQLLLEDLFHAEPSHIYTLKDSQATKSAIQAKIAEIAQLMDDNDYFFFYYSGHGGPTLSTYQYSWNIQSTHPYSNNMDYYWHYKATGAEYMRVHFTKIDVEEGYDGVYVGDNNHRNYFYDLFTGYYTNVWSNYVDSDDIYVNLYSDYIYTYWGFAVDLVEVVTFVGPYFINPYDGIDTGISGGSLDSYFDLIPGKIIGIMDSCFSGGVGSAISASNRYIISACTSEESSLEDTVYHHGVFTDQFLKAWNTAVDSNLDSVLSFEEVFPVAQTGTIQRSTAIGYIHHPVEFDGIPGPTVLTTKFHLKTYSKIDASTISYSYYYHGLGYGFLTFSSYNFDTQSYSVETVDSPLIGSTTLHSNTYNYLSGSNMILMTFKIQSHDFIDISRNSLDLTSYAPPSSADSDGDEITDNIECTLGLNPWSQDSDNDGLSDNDEINIIHSDALLNDTDGDSLSDGDEKLIYSTDIFDPDTDDDFLTDGEEIVIYFTDPCESDTDGDGILDGIEIQLGINPLSVDSDGDTLTDGDEVNILLTDPSSADSDDDGLLDNIELSIGLTPTDADTDDDQLIDGLEVNVYSTNPLDSDTDNDLLNDGLEVNVYSTNPLDSDTDNDGLTDGAEIITHHSNPLSTDSDADGLQDYFEVISGLNPSRNDSDNDGLLDLEELEEFHSNPIKSDSDGDSLSDYDEIKVYKSDPNLIDSDEDGISDYDEIRLYNTNPIQSDSDFDGFLDGYEIEHQYNPVNAFDSPLLYVYLVLEGGLVMGGSLLLLKRHSRKHPSSVPSISQERPSYEIKIHRKKKTIYRPPPPIQRPMVTPQPVRSSPIYSQNSFSMRSPQPWFYSFIPPQIQVAYSMLSYDQQMQLRRDLAAAYELAALHEFGPGVVQNLPRCYRCNRLLANFKCFYCDN